MLSLALRSLRFRTGGFVASFIAMFLGATILMTFASMLDTSRTDGLSSATRETLTTMAVVVGGWGLVIVLFAVVSTLTLLIHKRSGEMALLKSVGATPGQIGRMIVGEATVLAMLSSLIAIPVAMVTGRLLLDLLITTDQVEAGVDYRFGVFALGIGTGITLIASIMAAAMTARRATRLRLAEAMTEAVLDRPRISRVRASLGGLFLLAGAGCAVVTASVLSDTGPDLMATAAQAGILSAIGFALLTPVLIRMALQLLARPIELLAGTSGYLTVLNARQRSGQLASSLMPIVLFVAIATGTIYMQAIENDAMAAAGTVMTNEQKNIETLNFVIVGMIAVFAAIMLINTLVAATSHRRREFGQQRLVGSTPRQVATMVATEAAFLLVTGVVFGGLASLMTIIPFSLARANSVVPGVTPWIFVAIVAVAVTLTLASSLGTTRFAIRTPAVEAVSA